MHLTTESGHRWPTTTRVCSISILPRMLIFSVFITLSVLICVILCSILSLNHALCYPNDTEWSFFGRVLLRLSMLIWNLCFVPSFVRPVHVVLSFSSLNIFLSSTMSDPNIPDSHPATLNRTRYGIFVYFWNSLYLCYLVPPCVLD